MAPLLTAGVSDEVVQELQIPIGPQILDDVEDSMPARLPTLKDPSTPDPVVLEKHSLTHFPNQPWCKMCVESRGRDSPHREQSKIDTNVPQLQFDYGYMGGRRPSTETFSRGSRHLFWSHAHNDGARLQEDEHALCGGGSSHMGA